MIDEKVPPEIQIYANCMEKVRQRVGVIIWAIQTVRTLGVEHFMWTELIFVQFRKILELNAVYPRTRASG